MSIVNLYKSGIKDMDIEVDNLTVNEGFSTSLATIEDLNLTGSILSIPDPLIIPDNLQVNGNLTVGVLSAGDELNLNTASVNLNDSVDIKIQDNASQALRILEDSNVYMNFNSTDGSEKVSIEKDLDLNSTNLDMATQASNIKLIDNNASALKISEDVNDYMIFDSTDAAELVSIEKDLHLNSTNLDMSNQASEIKIIDNNASALKISEAANDYMIFDSTDTAEIVSIEKDLHLNSTNLNVSNQDSVILIGDNSANSLDIKEGANSYLTFDSSNASEKIIVSKDLDLNSANLDMSTQASNILMIDNSAIALDIKEGANSYLTFDSSNAAEKIIVSKDLDFDSSNLDMSTQSSNIKIIDNNATALKIQEATNDYITIVSTNGSENVNINKQLVCDTECIVSNSSNIGALSKILVESNDHTWSNAQAPGANILSISVPSSGRYYRMEYEFEYGGTNTAFFMSVGFNTETGAEYSYLRDVVDVSATNTLVQANSQSIGRFMDFVQALDLLGSGFTEIEATGGNVPRIGLYTHASGKLLAAANNVTKCDIDTHFDNQLGAGAALTSIEIDVGTNQHSGCFIQYRLYRMA
jgi:hypothetical protein